MEIQFRTYLEASIAESPDAYTSQSLVVSHEQGTVLMVSRTYLFLRFSQALAHVLSKLRPQNHGLPFAIGFHRIVHQLIVLQMAVEFKGNSSDSFQISPNRHEMRVSIIHHDMGHSMLARRIEKTSNASVLKHIANTMLPSIIHPLADKREFRWSARSPGQIRLSSQGRCNIIP